MRSPGFLATDILSALLLAELWGTTAAELHATRYKSSPSDQPIDFRSAISSSSGFRLKSAGASHSGIELKSGVLVTAGSVS